MRSIALLPAPTGPQSGSTVTSAGAKLRYSSRSRPGQWVTLRAVGGVGKPGGGGGGRLTGMG